MVTDIMDFFEHAMAYSQPDKIRNPAGALFYALSSMKHNTKLCTTIDGSGAVTYYPRLKDSTVDKPRTTSLSRLVRYLSQVEPVLNTYYWQPLQDEIVKWAAMELGSDYWSFEEVTSDALIEAYRTGPYSCMRGRNAQLQLYAINPEKVALLKVYQQGVYAGRALVWTADDGQRMLDRVYPGNGTLSFAARRHAKSNGWMYKSYDGVGSGVTVGNFSVTLKHPTNRRIPYLDTVRYVAACSDESITLTPNHYTDGVGYFQSVGNYTGFARQVYSAIRYTDGGVVVTPYVKTDSGQWRFRLQPLVAAQFYGRGGRRVEMALRPTDTIYLMPNEVLYRTKDYVCKIGEFYYTRKDVRKRRGLDEYTPKAGATAMFVADIITLSNGTTAVILGVSA